MLESTSALALKMKDQDVIAAIQKNGMYIDRVEKTPERCLAAVKQNGHALKKIPKALHTVDLCHEAVKQNGLALEYISEKVLTNEICLEAVRKNGTALSYVLDKFQTRELRLEAIKQAGEALQYIPEKYKSKSVCMKAVMQNGLALRYVPSSMLSKEFYLSAVEQNGLALEYVPSNSKSKGLCLTAVNNNVLALKYVPNRFKIIDLCHAAVLSNWRSFLYMPESMYTLESCLKLSKQILSDCDSYLDMSFKDRLYIKEIFKNLPDDVRNEIQIIRLERQLKVRCFEEKLFDRSTNKFMTKESICYREEDEVKEFETFTKFYEYVDGNLENSNLYDFDFKGIKLKDFNIEGAYISSAVLIAQKLYDDSFFSKNIRDYNNNSELMFSSENEVVEASTILHDSDFDSIAKLNEKFRKIYYISDIHLDHKLKKEFPSHATKQEVIRYIRQLIHKMVSIAAEKSYGDYLLIAGDISYNFEISTLFYSELVNHWSHHKIVVVLGNHELWDFSLNGAASAHSNTLEDIIQRYRELFINLGICFLQNELLILNETEHVIISEEQLKSINPDELKISCLKSSLVILGGLGYSGLSPDFNAAQGIYRETIKSLDEDIEQTKLFELIYKKVNNAIGDNRVIILTHTPKENWSHEKYNSNWIYVNGHTHRNDYYYNDEKTVYADNQIGYYTSSVGLKYFNISKQYDIFKYYTSGIYIISREQYINFNRGVGINLSFNRIGKIHMLKNRDIYCFIFEKAESRKFYLLNGGVINKLEHNDINYYFERIPYYSDTIKGLFSGYHQELKSISNNIKSIGGTGTIHGCIVDIDFYNHIYVNPEDGTMTPYYALSTVDKYVYRNVGALLKKERKDLYDNYTKFLDGKSDDIKLLKGEINVGKIETSQFISETAMYRPSRIMRSLQYLTDVNIIRVWNDQVMDIQPRIED